MIRAVREISPYIFFRLFFFNATATTEIYTLSLHDALPICPHVTSKEERYGRRRARSRGRVAHDGRSEEHTSELQSHSDLVCRLLLEKKKKNIPQTNRNQSNPKLHPAISKQNVRPPSPRVML